MNSRKGHHETVQPEALVGAFRQAEAEAYIGMGEGWLDNAPIEKSDIRKPGAKRPVWVWRRTVLDAFLESRAVLPAFPSPFGD
jgi:hypothetical protein